MTDHCPAGDEEALPRLMEELRPRLHRYCARMVGSALDGEDVVQEALIKAAQAWPAAGPVDHPDRWLLRIAHNTALDWLRRRRRQAALRSQIELDPPAGVAGAQSPADARVAVAAGLSELMRLPVAQRGVLVLTEVLGHSLAETAEILDATLPATKAALHRARARLQALAGAPDAPAPVLDEAERARLQAYADRFNARDFDALRALLAEEVRLDLVNRARLEGRKDVAVYFTRYDGTSDWRVGVGMVEGRPALMISDLARPEAGPAYPVLLDWRDGRIVNIRDFRFARYVMDSLG